VKSLAELLVRLFYPNVRGANPFHVLALTVIPQKFIGFNRFVGWPVHWSSRVLHRRNIRVGKRSFPGFSANCYIQGRNGIVIGHNLRMGPGVGLVSADHDPDDYDHWRPSDPIRIGDNVWIGMNSVVLPGVNIGSNVVIGANSVVVKDIPDNCIACGNPARKIADKGPYQGRDYSVL